MSHRRPIEPVEDFTTAFLVSFGVLLFILLSAIHALFGLIGALAGGLGIRQAIVIGGALAHRRRRARGPQRW